MGNYTIFVFQVVAFLLVQCSVSTKENPTLIQAAQVHNVAVAEANELESLLDRLSADTTFLNDSLISWKTALENWRNNLIEVPGNEKHDEHAHDHRQHGNQLPDITAEQMLSIQQEMKQQLDSLKSRITKTRNEKHL